MVAESESQCSTQHTFNSTSRDINNNDISGDNTYYENYDNEENDEKNNNTYFKQPEKDSVVLEVPYLLVVIPKTYASHSFCFICKKKSGN